MDGCHSETAGAWLPWIGRAAALVAGLRARAQAGLSRAAMDRRVLQQLSTLSDRELKDIGLTPQDVADAGVPGTEDAIGLLIGRRAARRRARLTVRRW